VSDEQDMANSIIGDHQRRIAELEAERDSWRVSWDKVKERADRLADLHRIDQDALEAYREELADADAKNKTLRTLLAETIHYLRDAHCHQIADKIERVLGDREPA